ncbi:YD repeat-containing protein, partial [Haloferula luteola]
MIFKRFGLGLSALALFSISIDRAMAACGTCAAEDSNTVNVRFSMAGSVGAADANESTSATVNFNGVTSAGGPVLGAAEISTPIREVEVEVDKPTFAVAEVTSTASASEVSCSAFAAVTFEVGCGYLIQANYQLWNGSSWGDWSDLQTSSNGTLEVGSGSGNVKMNVRVMVVEDPSATCQSCSGDSPEAENGEDSSTTDDASPASLPNSAQDAGPMANGMPTSITPSQLSLLLRLGETEASGGMNMGWLKLNGEISQTLADVSKLTVGDRSEIGGTLHVFKVGSVIKELSNFRRLAVVTSFPTGGFKVECYGEGDYTLGSPSTLTGSPYFTLEVLPITILASVHYGGIQITRHHPNGETEVTTYLRTSNDGSSCQIVSEGGALIRELASVFTYNSNLHEWERTDVDETRRDGALISKTQETTSFQLKRDASNVVYDRAKFRRERWVYDSDSTWLTTQWNPHPDVLGRVLSVVRPDGRWEAYSYYDDYTDLTNSNRLWKHRLKTIVRPWLDGPTTPPAEPWTVSTSTAGYELVEVAYSRVGMNIVKSQERTFKNGILSNIQNFEVEEVSFTSDNEPVDGNESDLRGWLADAGVDSAWLPKAKSIFWTRSSESADASNELSEMVSNGLSFSYVSNDTDGSISAGVKTFGRWVGSFAGSVDEEGNGSVVGYERGNFSSGVFTPSSFSGTSPTMGAYLRQVRVKVLQGSVVRPHRGSREVRIIDAYGKLLREEFHVVDGSGDWKIATVRTYEYPVLWSNEHPREVIGKTWDFTEGSGGTVTLLASRILFKKEAISGYETAFWSENGEEQRVVVDQSGRLVSQTKVGVSGVQPDVVTSYDYQGLTTITTTTGGDQVARKQIVKDAAGREVASVNAAGAVIRTSYLNGGRDVLVTRPGGITELTSRNLSGDLVSRTGSGTVDEVYSYALLSNGHQVVTRRVGDDLSNSPRYVLTQTDGAGRVVEERTPSPTGTGEVTENFFYLPGTRRLERRVSPKGDFYQNVDLDLSGNGVEYSGEDFDGGGLAILSRDSLTARLSYYVKEGDDWWEVNAQRVYDGIDGSSGSFLETLSKRCLNEFADGWASWNVQVAPTGATTESTELVDWANKTVTVSTVGGGASNAVVTVNRNGLLLSRQTPEQSQPDTWEYDGLGRIVTEISARGAVKRRSYQADGSVAATTDDRGKVTRYETYGPSHTSSGLTSKIQYPDGTTRIYRYSPLGQLIEETGTAGYRVTYGYDEFGVKDRMWTWRSGSTSDQTTWVYQAGTGLLLQKKDAANQGVSYSYYPSGKVSVRTWARGVSATYTYSDGVNGSGHLIGVNYSDTTPDLTMFYGGSPTYDRMGRVYQVAQASRGTEHYRFVEGNTTVSSEQTMKGMLKEMYHSTSHQLFAERGLVFERDSYGRLNEVQETSNHWVSGFTVVRTVEYSYDANTGLLKQVDDGAQNHQYAYDANSPWVSQVQTRHTARLWFQEDRYRDAGGRILGVRSASVAGGTTATPVASHAYQYDAMNRREKETYLDGSYREIGYNDHSEVTSVSRYDSAGGAIPQLDSAYAYDGIGNRLLSSSEVIGDRSYTPNSLNQWAQVTHGSERLALGRAPTNWTVMVDGIESNRNGEIYYQGVSVDNATAPVWQTVKTKKMGATSVNTGYLWFDQAALVPSYDADGNLL